MNNKNVITYTDRKILKRVISISNDQSRVIPFEEIELIRDNLGISSKKFLLHLNDLEHASLITVRVPHSSNTPIDLTLTTEGLRYFDFRMEKLKSFFMRSILTPAIVSIITTLLTFYIKSLFK